MFRNHLSVKSCVLTLPFRSASAQAATLRLVRYEIQLHRQRVLVTTAISLDYSLGRISVGRAPDCATGKTQVVDLGVCMFGGVPPSRTNTARVAGPTLSEAALESGSVVTKTGVLNVGATGMGPPVGQCQQDVLEATLINDDSSHIVVPVFSQEAERTTFSTDPLQDNVNVLMPEGDVFANETRVALFDLGSRETNNGNIGARVWMPLRDSKPVSTVSCSGQSQTDAEMNASRIPPVLMVYTTLDHNT